jgi:D-serine deaminase-like pyridoxal phosphate-dependent protein
MRGADEAPDARWRRYERALDAAAAAGHDVGCPVGVVDLPAFDANVARTLAVLRARQKKLRVATKSLRARALVDRVLRAAGADASGLMAYHVDEAAWLAAHGYDDVLVAYPTLSAPGLARLAELAAEPTRRVSVVVDDRRHVDAIGAAAARRGVVIPVVLDVDASLRLAGDRVHLGVRRSPLADVEAALAVATHAAATTGVRVVGLMVYEAQIAGLPDRLPGAPLESTARRLLKRRSRTHVAELRARLVDALRARGLELPIVNGGGSGSLGWSASEAALTEVTVGSAFLGGHLFDRYVDEPIQPAACFAVEVVRAPAPGWVTCLGGGFVASGASGPDRSPQPYLPAGLTLAPLEGAGEVQTPLRVAPGHDAPPLGARVYLRHAKSGELAEHLTHYLLVDGEAVVGRADTYRGEGRRFLG